MLEVGTLGHLHRINFTILVHLQEMTDERRESFTEVLGWGEREGGERRRERERERFVRGTYKYKLTHYTHSTNSTIQKWKVLSTPQLV